ncbi:hypothetical protein Tco_0532684 [Tanacetum coccineum]
MLATGTICTNARDHGSTITSEYTDLCSEPTTVETPKYTSTVDLLSDSPQEMWESHLEPDSYKMMNEMIRNNLTVATMQVNVQFLQQLQPEWSRFVTIVKQQHKLAQESHNPLALVATAQTLKVRFINLQLFSQILCYQLRSFTSQSRSHATTRYKGKEMSIPIHQHHLESALTEDKLPHTPETRTVDTTPRWYSSATVWDTESKDVVVVKVRKGFQRQAELSDWLRRHGMKRLLSTDAEPLEKDNTITDDMCLQWSITTILTIEIHQFESSNARQEHGVAHNNNVADHSLGANQRKIRLCQTPSHVKFKMTDGEEPLGFINKSKKRLVVESFDWDEESLSSEDEGVTRVKSFMAIIEDETVVGKVDARSGQWVEITMKKIQQLMLMTDCDERKHVLDYTYSDLHYVKDLSKNLLSKFNSLKQELSSRNSELVDLKDAKVHVGIKRLFEAV